MNNTLKRVFITVLVIAVLCGAVWGGLVIFRNAQKKPVNVYAVQDFAMTEYWGDSSQTYGMISTDKLQNVYISDTQTVREIYVEEGQEVKTGDPILAYDTTLSDIDLEKAGIDLQKLQLQKETAEKELTTLYNMRPHSSVLITPEPTGVEYISKATPFRISGSGTEEDPFYYLWGEDDAFSLSLLAGMFPEVPAEPEEPDESADAPQEGEPAPDEPDAPEEPAVNYNESYVVFLVREHDALNAPIQSYWGLHLDRSGGDVTFRFYQPELSEEIQSFEVEPEPYYEEYGSDYTAAELAVMRSEKEQEIRDLEVSIKLAQVEYDKLEQEVNDGVVRSTIDGTVKVVRDPDEAYQNSEAVVEVSGGGGYYIDVSLSELELGTVEVGQTVQVNCWETGAFCEGTIVEISEYPTTNSNSWSDGNSNVSYYPFRVFVDESADLRAYAYADVTYENHVQEGDSLYLENEFIRTDGGRSYVYVRNADGLLEQRTIQTGRSLWGSYTQVRGGLTIDDYVAFPYGKDVADGAKTVEATAQELYGY